jgi:hypothetical protein
MSRLWLVKVSDLVILRLPQWVTEDSRYVASLVQHNELENHHFSWEKITINGDVP